MLGKVAAVVLLAVVIQHLVRLTLFLNTFQKIFNHAPGPCRHLHNISRGAENGYLLQNGLLFLSSDFGNPPSKLLMLDLDSSDGAEEFTIQGDFDAGSFSTHGLGAWEDPETGEVTLFAVNHHKDGERVEVFLHDGSKTSKTLKHVKTIRDPKMPILNDIVATGPDSFYATQFFTWGLAADFFTMYPGGGVVHHDRGKTSIIVTGLWMANGINISPNRQYLYVVDAWQNLRAYTIHSDGGIQEVQVYASGTCLDNIHVDRETGELWIGAYSNGLKMARHLSGAADSAYSQVLRVKIDDGRIGEVKEIYANDGSEISGSSIAIPYKTKLFIGSVVDRAIICDLVYAG